MYLKYFKHESTEMSYLQYKNLHIIYINTSTYIHKAKQQNVNYGIQDINGIKVITVLFFEFFCMFKIFNINSCKGGVGKGSKCTSSRKVSQRSSPLNLITLLQSPLNMEHCVLCSHSNCSLTISHIQQIWFPNKTVSSFRPRHF